MVLLKRKDMYCFIKLDVSLLENFLKRLSFFVGGW